MAPTTSNQRERANAIFRAIGLVFLVILLTGFGVALFDTEKYFEKQEYAEDCDLMSDTLANLKDLNKLLAKMENLQDSIGKYDRQWDEAREGNLITEMSDHKSKIEVLERQMGDTLSFIKNEDFGDFGHRAGKAYDYLLSARSLIWGYRGDLNTQNQGVDDFSKTAVMAAMGGMGSNEVLEKRIDELEEDKEELEKQRDKLKTELEELRENARTIVGKLRNEASDLEDVRARGIFGKKEETNEKIQSTVSVMNGIVEKIINDML